MPTRSSRGVGCLILLTAYVMIASRVGCAPVGLPESHTISAEDMATDLIGFDCNHPNTNVTTISNIEVESCPDEYEVKAIRETRIQLLQQDLYATANLKLCKVTVRRTAYYCGMHSHVSVLPQGDADYMYEVGREQCRDLHSLKVFNFQGHLIRDVSPDKLTVRHVVLAGSVSETGYCTGGYYSDRFGTYEYALVRAQITIELRQMTGRVDMEQGKVIIPSGISCRYLKGYCLDTIFGETVWDAIDERECPAVKYTVLYEGSSKWVTRPSSGSPPTNLTTVIVEQQDTSFALDLVDVVVMCNTAIFRTEHPRLLITEGINGMFVFNKRSGSPDDLDMLTYVNSKFVYVERHIRGQITALYSSIQKHRCNLKRQVLLNTLSLARNSPDEFSYLFNGGPGSVAMIRGEVIHIARCSPVPVKLAKKDKCYTHLPVTYKNQTKYLTPKTRIIVDTSEEIKCIPLLSPTFRLMGGWFSLGPHLSPVRDPLKLSPNEDPDWKYVVPASLARSGIYSDDDLKSLRRQLIQPLQVETVSGILTSKVTSHSDRLGGVDFGELVTPDTIQKAAESYLQKTWGFLSGIGQFASGVIGILMIYRMILYLVSVIMNGYLLYSVFGLSLTLLGAVWSNLVHCLLAKKRVNRSDDTHEQGHQLIPSCPTPAPRQGIGSSLVKEQDEIVPIMYRVSEDDLKSANLKPKTGAIRVTSSEDI